MSASGCLRGSGQVVVRPLFCFDQQIVIKGCCSIGIALLREASRARGAASPARTEHNLNVTVIRRTATCLSVACSQLVGHVCLAPYALMHNALFHRLRVRRLSKIHSVSAGRAMGIVFAAGAMPDSRVVGRSGSTLCVEDHFRAKQGVGFTQADRPPFIVVENQDGVTISLADGTCRPRARPIPPFR